MKGKWLFESLDCEEIKKLAEGDEIISVVTRWVGLAWFEMMVKTAGGVPFILSRVTVLIC